MRNKRSITSLGLFTFISIAVVLFSNGVHSQALPDLMVTRIECVPPRSKLSFTVANRGNAPLSRDRRVLAQVYLPGGMKQMVDLGKPTSGNIGSAGGSATYVLTYEIRKRISVKVIVDSTNNIKESNEENNEKEQRLEPCRR